MIDFSRAVLRPAMAAFSRPVTFQPKEGAARAQRGVFDNKAVDTLGDDGFVHATTRPQLGIRLSEWPTAPKKGDGITVDGTAYNIGWVEPDGQGGATLILHKV